MRVIVLGSAAGGGLPQWNCGCGNCQDARLSGTGRTQSSVALSADGARWVLLNASPDLRAQLAARPELWPRGARGTAISAVVCTDGEIDHTLGLLLLREAATRFPLYAPAGVVALLDREWPVLRVLSAYAGVEPRVLPEGSRVALADGAGRELGVTCTAVPVARRPPRYARQATAGTYDVALRLSDQKGATLAYVPTAAGADAPTAREMGHLPVGGPGGSIELLPRLGARRTVLVHINNTNPILSRSSSERAQVEGAGIEVAEDGMEVEL